MQPIHLRMARAALGWTLKDLAVRAGVNLNTISRYEAGKEALSGTIISIEEVFKRQGITFIDDKDGTGLGVILKSAHSQQDAPPQFQPLQKKGYREGGFYVAEDDMEEFKRLMASRPPKAKKRIPKRKAK